MPHTTGISDSERLFDLTHFENRLSQLVNERESWETVARDLALFTVPQLDRYRKWHHANKDRSDFSKILDSTATLASETLSAGLMSGVTNPARKWLKLSFPNLELNQESAVKIWLEEVTRVMLEIFNKSNLYNVLPSLYQEIGLFGTGVIFVQEDEEDTIRCYNFAPGEYFLATDEKGRVNTVYRDFTMTPNQMIEQFGLHRVSQSTRDLAKDTSKNHQQIRIAHAMEPITEKLSIDKLLPFDSQFRSVYYERGSASDLSRSGRRITNMAEAEFLDISGYPEFPAMAPRWNTVSNDVYGYGRGHVCLGDVKQLQFQTRTLLLALEKQVKPPLSAPVGTNPGQVSTMPDHISFYNAANGQARIEAMYQVNLDMGNLNANIAFLQNRINQTFFVDAFRMFSQLAEGGVKTATETLELKEEKLLALGSVLQRLNDELLDPLVDRVFGIAFRQGKIPLPPEEIQGQPIAAEYVNILADAQKSQGVGVMERAVAFAGGYAQATQGDTTIFDKINAFDLADRYFDSIGFPSSAVVPTQEAQAAQQQRQRMAMAQQAAELASSASQTAKTLDETGEGEGTQLGLGIDAINSALGN